MTEREVLGLQGACFLVRLHGSPSPSFSIRFPFDSVSGTAYFW